jgi:hypothetical protein
MPRAGRGGYRTAHGARRNQAPAQSEPGIQAADRATVAAGVKKQPQYKAQMNDAPGSARVTRQSQQEQPLSPADHSETRYPLGRVHDVARKAAAADAQESAHMKTSEGSYTAQGGKACRRLASHPSQRADLP